MPWSGKTSNLIITEDVWGQFVREANKWWRQFQGVVNLRDIIADAMKILHLAYTHNLFYSIQLRQIFVIFNSSGISKYLYRLVKCYRVFYSFVACDIFCHNKI